MYFHTKLHIHNSNRSLVSSFEIENLILFFVQQEIKN